MRLPHALALTASLSLICAVAACDSGNGGATGTATTPGSDESAFDDLFRAGGSLSGGSNEATSHSECPADDPDCGTATAPAELDPPQCTTSLPIPAGAGATCAPLCRKIAECRGDDSVITACVADCADSLRGVELVRAGALFGCVTAATCEDLGAYGGDGSAQAPTPAPAPAAGEPGSDSGGADADPYDPEGGYEHVAADDPIGDCMEALFEGWSRQALPPAKLAVCEETLATKDACDDGDVVSSGSSRDQVPASSTDAEEPGDGDDGGDDPDPMPPEDDDDGDDDEGQLAACTAAAGLMSQELLDRVRACYDEQDCATREACLGEQFACAPWLAAIGFGGVSSVGDSPAVTDSAPNPTDPADGE